MESFWATDTVIMFNLKLTGVRYEFDVDSYKKALMTHIEKGVKAAAREFAKTALSRIPVRTGFVAGSFGALTDLLGSGARFLPIVQFTRRIIRAAKSFLADGNNAKGREYYYPESGGKVLKTPEAGRQFATTIEDIFKWQDFAFIFTFAVNISYFRINDAVAGHAPTAPWQAFQSGMDAFEKHLETTGLKFDLKLDDFINEVKV